MVIIRRGRGCGGLPAIIQFSTARDGPEGSDAHSLGERVRAAERQLYPTVMRWFAEGRVKLLEDGRVEIGPRVASTEFLNTIS